MAKLKELFGIDVRSLALFRIGLGLLILADLSKRALTLSEHYTDQGVLPREAALELLPDPGIFGLYFATGNFGGQCALFLLAGLLALFLMAGFHTRIVSVASLYLLLSLQCRTPLVNHTGDDYLAVLLFWAIFLPLGSTLAVDSLRRRDNQKQKRRVVSMGTVAILIQIAVFYIAAGLHKHQYDVWVSGDALTVFLGMETYTTSFGRALSSYPSVGRVMTYGTLVLEIFGPLLLFCPIWTARLRCLMVAVFAAFHIGINLSVHIGLLELLSILAVCVFLPSEFWDGADKRLSLARVRALSSRIHTARARFAPHPSTVKIRGLRRLGMYGLEVAAAASLGIMLVTNYESFGNRQSSLPPAIYDFAHKIHLQQSWTIFANILAAPRGWFHVVGKLENGTRIDVLSGEEFRGLSKPKNFSTSYANHNQRRHWHNLANDRLSAFRPSYARFLCRQWNQRETERLMQLGIIHVHIPLEHPDQPIQRVLVVQKCDDGAR